MSFRIIFAILILAPLCVSGPVPGSSRDLDFCLPRIHSGDEPHYLVTLHSLLIDGDLDVSNNYAAVHRGCADAGINFAGFSLDHHVSWHHEGELRRWHQLYYEHAALWDINEDGQPIPKLKNLRASEWLPKAEYSWHPPGLPALLAVVLYPFRESGFVEHLALICTAVLTIVGMLLFESLLQPYCSKPGPRLFVVAVAFLGTPVWHYSRTLFCEPYLLVFLVSAYALAFRRRGYLAAGLLIGLGILMKPPFALMAFPLGINICIERDWRSLVALSLPVCLSVAAILLLNNHTHGGYFYSSLNWESGNPLLGVLGLLFSLKHGLLAFAPAAITVFAWRHFSRESVLLLLAVVLYFGLMATWKEWHGGWCYGPRLIVPILPLLFIPLGTAFQGERWPFPGLKQLTIGICIMSIAVNAVGAFGCGWSFGRHPVELILRWTTPYT